MLSTELQSAIDQKWESFWPVNHVKPLIIADLITYLLFIKRLDELQLLKEKKASLTDQPIKVPIYTQEQQELRWSSFKNLDRNSLYALFTKQNGVLHFIRQYGREQRTFSRFLKTPLLITPTANVLANAVSLIQLMDEAG